MPEKMSVDKRVALATLGAQVIITPNAPPSQPRQLPQRRAAARGGARVVPDRSVRNPANVRVHAETTAVEILEQTGGRVGAFVAAPAPAARSAGSVATSRPQLPRVQIVLADPVGSGLADWVETGARARRVLRGRGHRRQRGARRTCTAP
jgi:cysteine synthase